MIKMNKRLVALYTISTLLLVSLIYISATASSTTAFSYTEETLVLSNNQIISGDFVPKQDYVLLSAVYDPITGLIYATNYYNGTLVIFDPNNNTIIGCIFVGPHPVSVAVNTQNGMLYVVSNSTANGYPSGTLFVVNPINKSIVSTISLSEPAYKVAVNPIDGYVYVAEPYCVVIFNQGNVVDEISLTSEICDMIYDPYTSYVVVSTKSYIFALNGVTVIANYSLTNNDGYSVLTVNPINGYIYGMTYGNFTVYNPTNLSPIESFNVSLSIYPVTAMVYDPTNGMLYIASTLYLSDIIELNVSNPQMENYVYQSFPSVIHSFVYDPENGNVYAIAETPTPIYLIKNGLSLIICDIRLNDSVYDPVTGYVYATNEYSNTIYVIGEEGVVETLSTVYFPYAITYNPRNGYLYVTSCYNDTVSEVNPYTGQVIWSAHVGSDPKSLLYDPYNGYLYVVNYYSGSVTVVDANNGTEIANVFTYGYPTSITLDPQNGYVYVADYSGYLTVINGTQVIANVKLGFNASSIAYINNYLYIGGVSAGFLFYTNPHIEVLDPSDYKVIKNISIPYYPQDIVYNEKDNSIYVVMLGPTPYSADGCLWILNPITLQTSYTAQLGIDPTSVSVNQSNGAVYITNGVSGTINIIIPIVQSPTTTSSSSSISINSSTSTVTSTSTMTSSSSTSTTTTNTVYSSTAQSSYTPNTSSLSTPSTPTSTMSGNNSSGVIVISTSTLTLMLILIMLILSVIVAIIVMRK